jgi:hypothetical protein
LQQQRSRSIISANLRNNSGEFFSYFLRRSPSMLDASSLLRVLLEKGLMIDFYVWYCTTNPFISSPFYVFISNSLTTLTLQFPFGS